MSNTSQFLLCLRRPDSKAIGATRGADCQSALFHGKLATCSAWLLLALLLFAATAWAEDTPSSAVPPERIQRLIRQLGDREYVARQKAEAELAAIGFEALDALREATTNDDFEIAVRATRLMRLIRVQWTEAGDPAEVRQMLAQYDQFGDGERLQIAVRLAGLPRDAGAAAVCRIIRYERSEQVSKRAALALLGDQKTAAPPRRELAERLRKGLVGSNRPAARWLLVWAGSVDRPETMTRDWAPLVEAEQGVLRSAPQQSDSEIVAALMRLEILWLKKLGRTEEVAAAIDRVVHLDRIDAEWLAGILQWLVDQKDWKSVDRLARQFSALVNSQPALLYLAAESQAARGEKTEAEQTAERAVKLFPGNDRQSSQIHLAAAMRLQQRGQFAWAKREYRQVLDASAEPLFVGWARNSLCEMLHDQFQDQEAGDVLSEAIQAAGKGPNPQVRLGNRSVRELRARMHYFYACHWQSKGDRARQREMLEKALADDPAELDALIACHRLPDAPAEFRDRIRKLIQEAADKLREEIENDSDTAAFHNHLAWLLGNTGGDLDEALRSAQRSLELMPDTAAYCDTIAHVYAARGDYENAVRYQTKAAEGEPHSGLIQRQLKVFREMREKKPK